MILNSNSSINWTPNYTINQHKNVLLFNIIFELQSIKFKTSYHTNTSLPKKSDFMHKKFSYSVKFIMYTFKEISLLYSVSKKGKNPHRCNVYDLWKFDFMRLYISIRMWFFLCVVSLNVGYIMYNGNLISFLTCYSNT